jgi:hypothetical protein
MFGRVLLSLLIIGLFQTGASRAATVGKGKQTKTPSKQQRELVKVCQESFEAIMKDIAVGRRVVDEDICIWSRRWLQAQLAVTRKKADKVVAHKKHLQRTKEVEKFAKGMVDSGKASIIKYTTAKYYRVQAEIWLGQAQTKK